MMCTRIVPEILRARKTMNNINNKIFFIFAQAEAASVITNRIISKANRVKFRIE